jgi:two-component system, LytTR family, response regulator
VSIRVLIVDDEPLARRSIRRFLKNDPSVEVIADCGDGQSAIAAIRSGKPDLVFLDVQMPEMDGFEVLRGIELEPMPAVIFVTAYDRYALRAFDANALDYLLKPFGRERFERALGRAKERIAGKLNSEETRRMVAALEHVHTSNRYAVRLPVAENGRIIVVKTLDIDWIEAEGNYSQLHTRSRRHTVRETLTSLQRKLNPDDFVRIHRSAIVNVHRVREIQPWFHGYHIVVLENGKQLRMSRYQREGAERLGLSPMNRSG